MHGSSNSATLIITAAGLAMVTAATFLVHAEKEKHQREQQQQQQQDHHDSAANKTSSSPARWTILLERQSSTVSRSKRDRIIYDDNEEEEQAEEEQDEEEEDVNHKPPVISIGVPTTLVTAATTEQCGPDGVDVSFDTHASVEEVSSCDDESTLLLAADNDAAVSDEVFKMTNREWKGMTAFFFLALLWGLGALLLPILVGTQSIDDVRTNLLEQADEIKAVLEHWSAVVLSLVPNKVDEHEEDTSAAIVAHQTTTRHVQGAYGPFFG
jgi:hypothetical protein